MENIGFVGAEPDHDAGLASGDDDDTSEDSESSSSYFEWSDKRREIAAIELLFFDGIQATVLGEGKRDKTGLGCPTAKSAD